MAEDDKNEPAKPAPPSYWGIPVDEWSGSGATKALHETINQFTEQSARQTARLIALTRVLAGLTFVMLIGLAIQIYLAVK
jgi:hypothetical protein